MGDENGDDKKLIRLDEHRGRLREPGRTTVPVDETDDQGVDAEALLESLRNRDRIMWALCTEALLDGGNSEELYYAVEALCGAWGRPARLVLPDDWNDDTFRAIAHYLAQRIGTEEEEQETVVAELVRDLDAVVRAFYERE